MQEYSIKLAQQCPICGNKFESIMNINDDNKEKCVAIKCPLGHVIVDDAEIIEKIIESKKQIQWIDWINSGDFDKIVKSTDEVGFCIVRFKDNDDYVVAFESFCKEHSYLKRDLSHSDVMGYRLIWIMK